MTAHTDPTNQTPPLVPGDLAVRQQTITSLRALADFLETNPGVPVDEYGEHYTVFPHACDDPSAVALVDQTAALLGTEITDHRSRGGHYLTAKSFGPITYRIVHIPEQSKRDARARDSYRSNVVLDSGQDIGRVV